MVLLYTRKWFFFQVREASFIEDCHKTSSRTQGISRIGYMYAHNKLYARHRDISLQIYLSYIAYLNKDKIVLYKMAINMCPDL